MRALKRLCITAILPCLPVTTQAHEGIETIKASSIASSMYVTTQAHEGIETSGIRSSDRIHPVTTQAHEGIEIVEHTFFSYSFTR